MQADPHQRSLVTATVDFDADGVHHGYIQVPYSHDGSAYGQIPIPVIVAKSGSGPTVLLTGGVHGDEYEGPVALMGLARELSRAEISGRVIIIPAVNFPAYLAGTRTSPIDRVNLNRCFPGDRNGTPTQMIAHYLETVLMPLADYCFDFHAGGASLNYLPTMIVDQPRSEEHRCQLERLIAAFSPPRVLTMDMLGEDRLIGACAERHKVCFFTGEFGGSKTLDLVGLDVLSGGLRNVLAALNVLADGQTRPAKCAVPVRRFSVRGPEHYLFATRPGLFQARFQLDEQVVAGEVAGYLHDPHAPWNAPEEMRFARGGVALCIRTHPLVMPGDCLGHLASEDP